MFIHNEIPWGRGPKSKLGLHFYFLRMYVYYQINLTGILYDVFFFFNNFVCGRSFHRVEFSTYGGPLVFKVSVVGALRILGL